MLDTDTKRRIDSARDVLVGKVPDPKSQVEQITIALIYKFMNDMDAEAEELGGKRKFFADEFARFGWPKLLHAGLGGQEVLNLYAEAIAKMLENPGIPPLFRDIFKNAYLPYRDPETLKMFLKIIDEFSYDHSERLGDAFEYLLSVLGSQGDAGQFRTPRHIIDFIVDIINPQKNETILDPACGTAGFLISSYKHILKSNVDANGKSTLTPDERAKLARNLRGYDISPDMVRLSLANLYLHGFTDPHVDEYDTLTSEDKWNEQFDVILANPPFMSPKGGIKPHKRFSIQSKRSEVLFVDYIAEHLAPSGRAGIIVPEGIIFQSQTAYKQLRKMLVEDYLVAVISLPGGIFQPYSGVKTSVLIMDKSKAKTFDSIAFFKVQNDGFGLGAQRRAIEKNDLPEALATLRQFLNMDRRDEQDADFQSCKSCPSMLIVPKLKLAENGEYNLSGERYREGTQSRSEFSLVPLGEICDINPDTVNPADVYPDTYFNYIDISCVENDSGKFLGANRTLTAEAPSRARRSITPGDVLISTVRPNLRAFTLLTETPERAVASTGFAVLRSKTERLVPGFLIRVLRDNRSVEQMVGMAGRGAYPSINQTDVAAVKIPLPPVDVQKQIVEEVEGYQKVIDGARAVINNYRPNISISSDWPMVELDELCPWITKGSSPNWQGVNYVDEPGTLFVTSENIRSGWVDLTSRKYVESKFNEMEPRSILRRGDVLTNLVGASIGRTAIFESDEIANINQAVGILRCDPSKLLNVYLMTLLNSDFLQKTIHSNKVENARANVSLTFFKQLRIPLPPLATQQKIVSEIEAEQRLVNASRELIERLEQKISATLARIWGALEPAKAEM
jgi:type I restriction enzyme M protein